MDFLSQNNLQFIPSQDIRFGSKGQSETVNDGRLSWPVWSNDDIEGGSRKHLALAVLHEVFQVEPHDGPDLKKTDVRT